MDIDKKAVGALLWGPLDPSDGCICTYSGCCCWPSSISLSGAFGRLSWVRRGLLTDCKQTGTQIGHTCTTQGEQHLDVFLYVLSLHCQYRKIGHLHFQHLLLRVWCLFYPLSMVNLYILYFSRPVWISTTQYGSKLLTNGMFFGFNTYKIKGYFFNMIFFLFKFFSSFSSFGVPSSFTTCIAFLLKLLESRFQKKF